MSKWPWPRPPKVPLPEGAAELIAASPVPDITEGYLMARARLAAGLQTAGPRGTTRVYGFLRRLRAAGIFDATAAARLTVDDRDRVLNVAAWGSAEAETWAATLAWMTRRESKIR